MRSVVVVSSVEFFLVSAMAALSAQTPSRQATPRQAAFDLGDASIADLQRRMASGQDTARSLVEKYLARIEAIDRQGPALHSVLETNPDALAIADRLDAERKSKGPRGPLHGIPILIKDNIATADRMTTSAGSLALAGSHPPKDAFIVERLREAGAVVLGKTNLSEWANFRSTHSSSGWSGRGGQTKNPYALDRNPSGSSSGSGAAAAASLAAATVGTETDGSIVSPSSVNSVVGIKPTLGLLSRTGIVPIAHSQDTAGPMARTVADAAVLLGAMVGSDPADPPTRESARKGLRDYSTFLDAKGLEGARIGVVRNKLFGYSPAADRLAEAAIADMKKQGAVIVDPANIPTLGKFDDSELEVLLYEFKADLAKYFAWAGPPTPIHSLKDVIAFNEAHKDQEMPYFGQELMTSRKERTADERGVPSGAREESAPVTHPRHRRGDDEVQARRARRADLGSGVADRSRQRGQLPRQTPRAPLRSRPSPAIRTSPYRWDTSAACRWGSRSSAARGASRRSSSSPTPTSRRPSTAGRRRSRRRPM